MKGFVNFNFKREIQNNSYVMGTLGKMTRRAEARVLSMPSTSRQAARSGSSLVSSGASLIWLG